MGRCCNENWVHGGCCCGDREQSHWRVGWQWLISWLLCVLCCLYCVLCVVVWTPTSNVTSRIKVGSNLPRHTYTYTYRVHSIPHSLWTWRIYRMDRGIRNT
jgi:hypothetical protein